MNHLDRRRGNRGLRTQPSLPDAQSAIGWLGRVSVVLGHGGQTGAVYDVVQAALAELCGIRLLTILRASPSGEAFVREHASHPQQFPVGELKPTAGDPWFQHMNAVADPEFLPDADSLRSRCLDARFLLEFGCESMLSVPVRLHGRNLGVINLMHKADWYRPAHGAICQPFAALVGAAWLADTLGRQ